MENHLPLDRVNIHLSCVYKILLVFFGMYMLAFTIFMMYYTYNLYSTTKSSLDEFKDMVGVIKELCPILGLNCTFILT